MEQNVKLARMRTISGIFEEIIKLDPQSQISRHFIRQAIISGAVPSMKAGCKYLVNLQDFLDYLYLPAPEEKKAEEYGNLRKID